MKKYYDMEPREGGTMDTEENSLPKNEDTVPEDYETKDRHENHLGNEEELDKVNIEENEEGKGILEEESIQEGEEDGEDR